MDDLLGFAVHRFARADHARPEGLSDALVAEADAEQRQRTRKRADPIDELQADAGLVRRAWSRREHEPLRLAGEDFLGGERVVPHHLHIRAQLAEPLDEVEGERVVVVDHEDAHATALPATAP